MPSLTIFGEVHNSENLPRIGSTISATFDRKKDVLLAEAWGARSAFEMESPLKREMYMRYREVAAPIYGSLFGETLNAYRNARCLPPLRLIGLEPLMTLDMMAVIDSAAHGSEFKSAKRMASFIKYGGVGIDDEFVFFSYTPLLVWAIKRVAGSGSEFKAKVEQLYGGKIESEGMPMPYITRGHYNELVDFRSLLQAQSILHYLGTGKNVYAICGMKHVKPIVDNVRAEGYPVEIYLTEPAQKVTGLVSEVFELKGVTINFMNYDSE